MNKFKLSPENLARRAARGEEIEELKKAAEISPGIAMSIIWEEVERAELEKKEEEEAATELSGIF